MRRRQIAAAAVALCLVSVIAVALALSSGRTAEQSARVIGVPTPSTVVSPTTTADPAPELEGITDWHNTPPLTLKALRGKVVLIDFWTYSCINCRRTFPLLRAL